MKWGDVTNAGPYAVFSHTEEEEGVGSGTLSSKKLSLCGLCNFTGVILVTSRKSKTPKCKIKLMA